MGSLASSPFSVRLPTAGDMPAPVPSCGPHGNHHTANCIRVANLGSPDMALVAASAVPRVDKARGVEWHGVPAEVREVGKHEALRPAL